LESNPLTTLAALLEHITASSVLDGAILLGSFAHGTPDAASDLDLIVCVRDGHFAEAWQQRTALQVTGAMVWWDQHLVPDRRSPGARATVWRGSTR
jgi:hypothetical protein